MSKNKGGREVRKPKQEKKPKAAAGTPSPLRVESSAKPQRGSTR
jgi:hypothetical protein